MGEPVDPRFLGGERAVFTDTSKMALVVCVSPEGVVDMLCKLPKPQAAQVLRHIADSIDPPSIEAPASALDVIAQALAPYDIPTDGWSEAEKREPAEAVVAALRDAGLTIVQATDG